MIAESERTYELTPTQEAMLVYSLYAPGSKAYFEQVCYEYNGPLDISAFSMAWQGVVDRHEILRSSFASDDGERPRRTVHEGLRFQIFEKDLRGLAESEQLQQRDQFLAEDCERGFELGTAPLIRVSVLQTASEAFWIVVSNHHIILDGWSMSLVRQEVSRFYQHLIHGQALNLKQAPPYSNYLRWLVSQDLRAAETYWRSELGDFVAPNILAIDNSSERTAIAASFAEKTISLTGELSNAIRNCARAQHLTLSTMLQGAWAVLLSRYAASEDVMFGITVSGRPYDLPDVESTVGLLINTLPLRARLDAKEPASAFLQRIQRSVSGALEFEHCPLKQIQNWTSVPFNMPLFDTLLVFENFAGSGSSFELDGPIETSSTLLSRTNYPLTLVVQPGSELGLQIVYHDNRFAADVIERMLVHLTEILRGIAADMAQPIGLVPMLTEAERRQLLVDFNNTVKQFPVCDSVTRMFEGRVEANPDASAVVDGPQVLTYQELNEAANRLARHLGNLGVGREKLVGICIPRSSEMIVAVLAVLKAGAAYVPLDPAYPKDRLAFMLADSGASVVLTQGAFAENLSTYAGKLVCMDQVKDELADLSGDNLAGATTASDAAYVIYTSGSTGKPKGTVIEHHSLLNFTQAASEAYSLNPSDRVLQFASLSFDTSVEEILPTLTTGATLVLRTDVMLSSGEHFLRSCADFGVTVLDLPTAYWHELTDEMVTGNLSIPSSIRLVILGGEKALSERLAAWREHVGTEVRLINTYGPTEATIVTTMCDLAAGSSPQVAEAPIGRPIANAFTYVLDSSLQPVPVGLPGELYIGGAGVARGYINRPEATLEKFIANPFANEGAARLYRTGDIVRYLRDGNLEFLGRTDNQVKIRGFRVELEEIEQAIRAHDQVTDAVVLAIDEAGDQKLSGYVVLKSDSHLTASELRQFLIDNLPGYMVPARFVFIDSIPVMPNGKTDRRALLSYEQTDEIGETFVGPRSPLEESIAEIWGSILRLDHPSIHDNFFELGGHSLMAAKLISNLRRQLHVELSLIDVFKSPTIAKLSTLIYERQTENEADEELAALLAEIEMMSDEEAQQRLTQEIKKGGLRGQALKLALLATGALQILSEAL